MKANTPEMMKFKKLRRKLNESRRGTIGLLEGLWIETARNSPTGDIGRFTNEEIAIMVDWDGDPDILVDAMVECRWLDVCATHRLVVHDWADHCPTYVKGGLARQKRSIAIATTSEVQPIGTTSNESASSSEVLSTKPSQAKPIQAKPSERQEQAHSPTLSKHFSSDEFRIAWDLWKQKQSFKNARPMDAITEQAQLYSIERFDTDEAIEILRFSTSRTNCVNLILNGDHKAKPPPDGRQSGGVRRKVPSFEEGLL